MHDLTQREAEELYEHREKLRELRLLLDGHRDSCLQCSFGERCAWHTEAMRKKREHEKAIEKIYRLTGLAV